MHFVEACPELESMVRGFVGRYFIDSVQEALKRAMLREALRRTRANYAHTAGLLGVRRQAVQQMVTRMGLKTWAESLRDREIRRATARLPSPGFAAELLRPPRG